MKKIYFTPEMEIIGVETEQMLATSYNLNDTEIDASESLAPGMEASDDDFDF